MPQTFENLAYLNSILENAPFLQLTSSKQAYPNHKGEGMPLLQVHSAKCKALIALQGAHVLSFTPNSSENQDFLWLSPNADFTLGKALRGGIPLCLPWFGPDKLNPKNPKHGFARNTDWELTKACVNDDDNIELHFAFNSPANSMWAWSFYAELMLTLGEKLFLTLRTKNLSDSDMPFSFALHSYHPVKNLEEAAIRGLAGRTYLDNLANNQAKAQEGDVTFAQEVDRYFLNVDNTIEIFGNPKLLLEHENCPSVITWNPGAINAKNIADIGEDNHKSYICAERGAVLDDSWLIAPNETKTARICLSRLA